MCSATWPHRPRTSLAVAARPPSQWTPTIAAPDPATWQAPEQGGGYAHGQVTHSSGLMFWLTGLRAKEVTCRMISPDSAVDMYNAATVMFENGALGTVSGAATLPDGVKFQVDIRIFGSEGVLLVDVERERVEVRRHDGKNQSLAFHRTPAITTATHPPTALLN